MEKEEIKNYINDQVRNSTDSAIMALTRVIGDYNNKLEKHREEENKFKEKILEIIRSEIKITINNKIDGIKKTQEQDREINEQFRKEIRDFITTNIKPIEQQFKKEENKKIVIKDLRKEAFSILVGVTVIATAAISAKQILAWIISNIIPK